MSTGRRYTAGDMRYYADSYENDNFTHTGIIAREALSKFRGES